MNTVYARTENGTTTHVSVREGLAEINHAMLAGKRDVRTMSSLTSTDYAIEYKDGRKVKLVRVDAPQEAGSPAERTALIQRRADGPDLMGRVVTVGGKDYVVSRVVASGVSYWSERNGSRFGATRTATAAAKPGTVARAIWDAANA